MPHTILTNGYDNFTAGSGDDTVEALADNDFIAGGLGNDSLNGGVGNDNLAGEDGDDYILGGDGDDYMLGDAGDDTMGGGAGDDRFLPFLGNDVMDGGSGWDLADFTHWTSGVTVNLNVSGPQSTGHGTQTLIGVEHIIGTNFADVLTGDGGDNYIGDGWGATALSSDTISAGGGNDLVAVWIGDHLIDGGSGVDALVFYSTTVAVTASLALQGAAQDTHRGLMTLTGFEGLCGGELGDTLSGDGGDNWLAGYLGGDVLSGGGGADVLLGDGVQDIFGLPGSGSSPILTLEDAAAALGRPAGDDTLDGGAGDDRLVGGLGNDMLVGGAGDDVLQGGGGIDTASYAGASGAVTVKLVFGLASGAAGADTLSGIEVVIGSAFDDQLKGANGQETLTGGDGKDAVAGLKGEDLLIGGNGDDTLDGGEDGDVLEGGAGADLLVGGSGEDVFRFRSLGESSPTSRDLIGDLDGDDKIDLSAIDADPSTAGDDAFALVGTFTGAAGQAVLDFDPLTGLTSLSLDVDGDKAADMIVDITGDWTAFSQFVW